MIPVKVGICVAYDWHLLEYALPLVYAEADSIVLTLDKDRISWTKKHYEFDAQSFHALVKAIDKGNKIRVLEEDFHVHDDPMKNEVYQRNRMAELMGAGGWHVQLDCDEYFIDFSSFVNYLRSRTGESDKAVNICCPLVTLYRKVEGGFLYVQPTESAREDLPVATCHPLYEYGRRNGYFNIHTNFVILHQSWARSEAEIMQKLENWGHKNDFDGAKYFDAWRNTTRENFKEMKNFHPIQPSRWPSLGFLQGESVVECIRAVSSIDFAPLSNTELWLKNSRLVGKIRQLLRR